MRNGATRRSGRTVVALLAGLLAGAWVGGGLVWVFNRTKIREAGGEVAAVSLAPADELAGVPADAAGFVHVRAADLWKTDGMTEYRRVLGKAGEDMLKALDDGFVPAPSTLDRVTVVALVRAPPAPKRQDVVFPPGGKAKGGLPPQPFQRPPFDPPPPPEPALDAVALLTFAAPFDAAKVREANLPKGVRQMVGDGEVWADDAAGVALAARGDRTLVVGPVPAVQAFLLRPKTDAGPLAPALKLASSGSRHVVAALNLRAYPLPADFKRGLPPEALPVLRADALAAGVVVGRGVRLDLRAAYRDDATAEQAEAELRKSAEAGRKALADARAKMQEAVAGRAGAPKPRPVAELPEAVGGLFALGATGMLDEWLANPPLERAGPELAATVTMESVGGAYATAAAMSVGMLLPAVQKVREAAARAQDQNNLNQIGLALHAHHDVNDSRLPAAGLTNPPNRQDGKALLSWRVAVLPYVEEGALYQQFKLDEPWDGPNNKQLIARMPKVFASPRGTTEPGKTHYRVFVSPENVFPRSMFGKTVGRSLNIPDRESNTIMVVEATDPVEWTKPEGLEFSPTAPFPRLGQPGAAGFHVLMGDASVRFIPRTTPPATIRIMVGADDGQVVPSE